MRALVASMTGDHPARPALVLSNRADAGGIAWATAQGIATEVVDHRPHGPDRAAFEAHQARTRASAWGRETAHIVRDFEVREAD